MQKLLLIFIFFLISFSVLSQEDSVKYNFIFQFKDGIYLDFEQIKNNNPVKFEQIIEPTIIQNDYSVFDSIENIKFYDNNGVLNIVTKKELWGYCISGRPYIYFADKFNMISSIGEISFFVTNIIVTRFYNAGFGFGYNSFYDPFPEQIEQEELHAFLLYWKNGNVFEYSTKSLEILLQNDNELANQYKKLSKRKKEKEKYNYIISFNERHPLYFPK